MTNSSGMNLDSFTWPAERSSIRDDRSKACQRAADTLFFRRRLRMQGNTALGVYLKNFLASMDPASLPLGNLVQPVLIRGPSLFERLA